MRASHPFQLSLNIEVWSLFGIWNLELGICEDSFR